MSKEALKWFNTIPRKSLKNTRNLAVLLILCMKEIHGAPFYVTRKEFKEWTLITRDEAVKNVLDFLQAGGFIQIIKQGVNKPSEFKLCYSENGVAEDADKGFYSSENGVAEDADKGFYSSENGVAETLNKGFYSSESGVANKGFYSSENGVAGFSRSSENGVAATPKTEWGKSTPLYRVNNINKNMPFSKSNKSNNKKLINIINTEAHTSQNETELSQNQSKEVSKEQSQNNKHPDSGNTSLENFQEENSPAENLTAQTNTKGKDYMTTKKIRFQSTAKKPDDIDAQLWADFIYLREAKDSPVTESALNKMRKDAESVGITLKDAIELVLAQNWKGFNVNWITEEDKKRIQASKPVEYLPEEPWY
jgi:hypothetical protein